MKKYIETDKREYWVSKRGTVCSVIKSSKKIIPLKLKIKDGYFFFRVGRKNYSVHRAVMLCYVPKIEGKNLVNHKDGNKLNNHIDNLEWCTSYENNNHAFAMGLNNSKKLSDEQAIEIVNLYSTGKYSSRELAKMYGVSDRIIMRIYRGKERKHLGFRDDGFRVKAGRTRKKVG